MTHEMRLDAAALGLLVARQREVAEALTDCARGLDLPHDWAQTPAQRRAAAALDRRCSELAEHLAAAGADAGRLAAQMLGHAAVLTAADTDVDHADVTVAGENR